MVLRAWLLLSTGGVLALNIPAETSLFPVVAADESNARQLRLTKRETQTRPRCAALTSLIGRSSTTREAALLLQKLCEEQLPSQRQFSNGCLYVSETQALGSFLNSNHSANFASLGEMFENAFFSGSRCPTNRSPDLKVTSAGGHSFTTCDGGFKGVDGKCVRATFVGEHMNSALKVYAVDGNIGIPRAWFATASGRPWINQGSAIHSKTVSVNWVVCEDGSLKDPEVAHGDVKRQMAFLNDYFRDTQLSFRLQGVSRIQNAWCAKEFCYRRLQVDGEPMLDKLAPRNGQVTVFTCDLDDHQHYLTIPKRLATSWIALNSRTIEGMRKQDTWGQTLSQRWGDPVQNHGFEHWFDKDKVDALQKITLARAMAENFGLVSLSKFGCDDLGDHVADTPRFTEIWIDETRVNQPMHCIGSRGGTTQRLTSAGGAACIPLEAKDDNNDIIGETSEWPLDLYFQPCHFRQTKFDLATQTWTNDDEAFGKVGTARSCNKKLEQFQMDEMMTNVMNFEAPERCIMKYSGSLRDIDGYRDPKMEKKAETKAERERRGVPFTPGQIARMHSTISHDYPSMWAR